MLDTVKGFLLKEDKLTTTNTIWNFKEDYAFLNWVYEIKASKLKLDQNTSY